MTQPEGFGEAAPETFRRELFPSVLARDESDGLEWQEYANCMGAINPDIFFPDKGISPEVKEFCSGCVVRSECLEYALVNREEHGVWGGTSARERRRILRQRAIARQAIGDV